MKLTAHTEPALIAASLAVNMARVGQNPHYMARHASYYAQIGASEIAEDAARTARAVLSSPGNITWDSFKTLAAPVIRKYHAGFACEGARYGVEFEGGETVGLLERPRKRRAKL